jgi:hypothetical protein
MNRSIILPVGSSQATIVQVKNTVLETNQLELKEIEKYQHQHPTMSMEAAAMSWIDKNAAQWRHKYTLVGA